MFVVLILSYPLFSPYTEIELANWLTIDQDIDGPEGGYDSIICLGNSFAHLPDFRLSRSFMYVIRMTRKLFASEYANIDLSQRCPRGSIQVISSKKEVVSKVFLKHDEMPTVYFPFWPL